MCPTFAARTDTYDRKHPENEYKYYPTMDLGTWELLGSRGSFGKEPEGDASTQEQLPAQATTSHINEPHSTKTRCSPG